MIPKKRPVPVYLLGLTLLVGYTATVEPPSEPPNVPPAPEASTTKRPGRNMPKPVAGQLAQP